MINFKDCAGRASAKHECAIDVINEVGGNCAKANAASALITITTCLLLALPTVAISQTRTIPDEYAKLMRDKETAQPLKSDLFGDQLTLSTGQIEFTVVDLNVPGNNDLPVEIRRRFVVEDRNSDGYLRGFGEWDIDVPHLSGTFASSTGWQSTSNNRCSEASSPPIVNGFLPDKYWHGNMMHIPGNGDQELLKAASGIPTGPTYYSSYPWVTSSNWYIGCLASTKNGYPGQGFVAVSPGGVRYFFDWAIVRPAKPISSTGYYAGGVLYGSKKILDRVTVFLMASRIEDRFGNWVTYTYESDKLKSITSNDGRKIDVRYNTSGNIDQITTANTSRSYTYHANGELNNVLLPDGSKWTYSGTGGVTQGHNGAFRFLIEKDFADIYIPPDYNNCSPFGGNLPVSPFVYTVTHPAGAVGKFTIVLSGHSRTYVERVCNISTGTPGNFKYAPDFSYFALSKKEVSGPGLSAQTWTYAHEPTTGYPFCQGENPDVCVDIRDVSMVAPDGSKTIYTFGKRFRANENQHLRTRVLVGTSTLKDEATAYLSNAESVGQAFPERLGNSIQLRSDNFSGVATRPEKRNVISRQGATFTRQVAQSGSTFSFDQFANPLSVTRFSSLGSTRTDVAAYHHNTAKWVIGQIATSTNSNTGLVESRNDHDATTALPIRRYAFGKLQQTLAYNPDGTLATAKDGKNNTTTFANWQRGIPQKITFADTKFQSAVVNDLGQISSVTDENGYVTGYAYDSMGRLSKITYPSADSTAWNVTNLAFVPVAAAEYGIPAGHWRQTVSSGNGVKVRYFDALWRPLVTREYDAGNVAGTQRFQRFNYDHEGRTTFTSYPGASDALTTGTRTTYDALGRPTLVKQDSELGVLQTKTEYLTGFKTKLTNPRGQVTQTSYLAYDQPTTDWPREILSPEDSRTTIYRNTFGNPTAIARYNGANTVRQTRWYVYDAQQQLCKTIDDETGATLLHYDGAGNLDWSAAGLNGPGSSTDCQYTDPGAPARKVVHTYDVRNRPKTLAFPDGLGNQTWTYTPDGRPASIVTDNGGGQIVTNTYSYNKRRLLTGERLQWGSLDWPIGYGYNANGHLATQNWHGLNIAYAPNALGQPTQAGTYATGVSYHPNGAIKQFTYGNGLVHTLTQNARQLPDTSCDFSGSCGAGAVLNDGYDYDQNGNVAAISDGRTGARGHRTMTYDGLDRLKTTASPMFGNAAYSYDVLDNLTRVTIGGTATRDHYYCYDGNWHLTNVKTGSCAGTSVIGLGYDVQGNLNNKNGALYTFDYGNRLRSVSNPASSYVYDGHGRRVRDYTTASKYSQYNHAGQLTMVSDSRAQKVIEYIHLGGSLVAARERDSANVYTTKYQHTDALGSPVAVTNESRTIIEKSEYEPYGKVINRPLTDGPGYTGHVADAATGLIYAQQRYLDDDIGRFLSVDPVTADSVGGNFNRYWYANNNPYKFTDPDGRLPPPVWGAIIGGAIGGVLEGYKQYQSYRAGSGFSLRAIAVETGRGAVVGALTTVGGMGGAALAKGAQLGTAATTATEVTAASMTAGYSTLATGPASDIAKGESAQPYLAHGGEAVAAMAGAGTGSLAGKAVGKALAKTNMGPAAGATLSRGAEEAVSTGVSENLKKDPMPMPERNNKLDD